MELNYYEKSAALGTSKVTKSCFMSAPGQKSFGTVSAT
jgi:hypothetical protein